MVIYFANRRMDTLGLATTELRGGFIISDDLKIEDTDTGVATFECYIHWTEETRELAKSCTTAGNYLLRSHNNDNEFYTIIESEEDTKDQTIYIYAEDAGMDLLNETVGEFAADEAYPIAWYVERFARDTGFEIGINEIADLSRKLEWTGEATSAGRIASVATQFDNAEISYSFEIKGLTITHKYINIHKKRGKDAGVTLRLNQDVDRIITTTSVADLATSLYVTGGIPEGEEDPIKITGYDYDDGDIYVMSDDSRIVSRSARDKWSRYIWENEPNQLEGYTGNIIKQWSYDTTSVSELVNRAITQLKKVCEPAVNYQIDIQQLPENVAIGDTVDIVDEKGELFLQSRILQLETSVCNEKQTATLGDFLIQESGISQTVRDLAEQFEQLAKSRTFYTWTAYADDAQGNGISLDPTGKDYIGTANNRSTPTVDISDPSVFTWVKVTGTGIEEINVYYGVSDSPEVVPTEWTTTPPEVLRNEYTWSYTEYIYTSGAVETTTPHIIAYYDYLEVDALDARTANIETLLAGQEGVGELQAIHLTADNVVIDDAVIVDAMIASLAADKITAGTIYTDFVKIANNEGQALWIDGATIQMKDSNKVVRIQMGMDAQGDYDYYLMDENEKIIWDARGLTEAGLLGNGAIIRDEAVADNAAIQGSKLDIVSVANAINENGNAIINAGSVYIGDDSMEVLYTTIEREIKDLEGVTTDGITKITPVYAVSDSATEAPAGKETMTKTFSETAGVGDGVSSSYYYDVTYSGWTPTRIVSYTVGNGAEETGAPVLTGNEVEFSLIGYDNREVRITFEVEYERYVGDDSWSEDQPIDLDEGQYVWMRYRCEYIDGHTEYSNPVLYVDATAVSVLQTEFSVINGQITSKIWLDDIKEATETIEGEIGELNEKVTTINSQWSTLDQTVDKISGQVGTMSTTLTETTDAVTGLTKTTESLESRVGTLELTDEGFTTTIQNIQTSISDVMAEGVSKLTPYFCANTDKDKAPADSAEWSIAYPSTTGGQYVWIKYLLEYEDGHTEWSAAYCLSDEYARSEISAAWTTIDQTAEKVDIQAHTLEDIDEQLTDISSSIEAMPDEIMLQVSEGYVTKGSLVLELDTKTGEATLSASAKKIVLDSGELVINSDRFQLTEDGYIVIDNNNFTVTKDGSIAAKDGVIGDFSISGGALSGSKVYLAGDGIKINNVFVVDSSGNVTTTGSVTSNYPGNDLSAVLSEAKLQIQLSGTTIGTFGYIAHNYGTPITTYDMISIYAGSADGITLGVEDSGGTFPLVVATTSRAQTLFGHEVSINRETYIKELTVGTFNQTPTTLTYNGTTYGYRLGKFVWIRIYGETASTIVSALGSFSSPAVNINVPMVFRNSSTDNIYLGYVYYNGSWATRVAASYAGNASDGANYNGTFFGIISYYTN